MALALLIMASLLFYLTSKHFPLGPAPAQLVARYKLYINGLAVVLAVAALWPLYQRYNGLTAFVMWFTALSSILSLLIVSIKINRAWYYLWPGVAAVLLIVDFL